MKELSTGKISGFTISEILTVLAIISILTAIAVGVYQEYLARAKSADVISSYDAARNNAAAVSSENLGDSCSEMLKRLSRQPLSQNHMQLSYGFEGLNGGKDGYRPVMSVCATAETQSDIRAAHLAYNALEPSKRLQPGAVLTSSVVSFSVALGDVGGAICKSALPAVVPACGKAPAAAAPPAASSAIPAPVPAAPAPAAAAPVATPAAPAAAVAAPPVVPGSFFTRATKNPATQPSQCYVCGDFENKRPCTRIEILPRPNRLVQCPNEKPYCMNSIYQETGQTASVYKRCVSDAEAYQQWYQESSDKVSCFKYDPNIYKDDLVCHLACSGRECNRELLPPENTRPGY